MKINVVKAATRKKDVQVSLEDAWREYIDYTDEQMAKHIELCRKKEADAAIDWDKFEEDFIILAGKVQRSIRKLAKMFHKVSS